MDPEYIPWNKEGSPNVFKKFSCWNCEGTLERQWSTKKIYIKKWDYFIIYLVEQGGCLEKGIRI